MKKLLKKLWTELTRVREIQFISYETDAEMQERLRKEPDRKFLFAKQYSKEQGV